MASLHEDLGRTYVQESFFSDAMNNITERNSQLEPVLLPYFKPEEWRELC